ncbi:hypothetical protein [Seinonella peptonophila]|nr:hypothetical protein [Seinonella peptonophila]
MSRENTATAAIPLSCARNGALLITSPLVQKGFHQSGTYHL